MEHDCSLELAPGTGEPISLVKTASDARPRAVVCVMGSGWWGRDQANGRQTWAGACNHAVGTGRLVSPTAPPVPGAAAEDQGIQVPGRPWTGLFLVGLPQASRMLPASRSHWHLPEREAAKVTRCFIARREDSLEEVGWQAAESEPTAAASPTSLDTKTGHRPVVQALVAARFQVPLSVALCGEIQSSSEMLGGRAHRSMGCSLKGQIASLSHSFQFCFCLFKRG